MLTEYKHVIFYSILLLGVPLAGLLAVRSRFAERVVLFIAMFGMCRISATINFFSHETYRGTSRGMEVTLVDMAILALLVFMTLRNDFKMVAVPPGSTLYGIYFLFSVLSIMNSANVLFSGFEVLKMVRMYIFYWVMFNYLKDFGRIREVLFMFALLVFYIFYVGFRQKYMEGLYQIRGPFPHQNSLAMFISVVGIMVGSMALNTHTNLKQSLFMGGVFAMSAVLEIWSLSRAGLMCFGGGCGLSMFLSYLGGVKFKKIMITLALGMAGAVILAYSMKTIVRRFETAPAMSKITRYHLAVAAVNMANDKFWGIGLNNFGVKVNRPYPYSKHLELRKYPEGFKEGLVETTYLMIAAETGWLNLGVFLCFLGYFFFKNLLNYWRYRGDEMEFLAIGIAGGLASIYVESTLEWVLKQNANFYQLMLVFAMIAAMERLYCLRTGKRQYPLPLLCIGAMIHLFSRSRK